MASPNEPILKSRYRLLAQQHSGGMGVIYKAQDLEVNRIVALKILRPSLVTDQEYLLRFQCEGRIKNSLSHPYVASVYDIEQDGATHFIVMEYVEGNNLKQLIKKETLLTENDAINLLLQIGSALEFAHQQKIVHAGFKSSKVMVTSTNHVKLLGFGLIYIYNNAKYPSTFWASPLYVSPEQAIGEMPTIASDIYSLGIVMFEMLTGKLPYLKTNQIDLALAHIRDRIPLVTEFVPNISDALSKIVYKAMSKKPSDRFLTVNNLQVALEQIHSK